MREIVNGIFYVLRGGIPWRLLPKDLPPKSTVYGYFSAWRDGGLFASGSRAGRARSFTHRGCSTAKARRRRRVAVLAAMMRARK